MLKRRKECSTYLATARRHRWRVKMTMKNDKAKRYLSFFIVILTLQRCLRAVARQVLHSFLIFNTFFIILPFQVFLFINTKFSIVQCKSFELPFLFSLISMCVWECLLQLYQQISYNFTPISRILFSNSSLSNIDSVLDPHN